MGDEMRQPVVDVYEQIRASADATPLTVIANALRIIAIIPSNVNIDKIHNVRVLRIIRVFETAKLGGCRFSRGAGFQPEDWVNKKE
jgi:hypothetical protein